MSPGKENLIPELKLSSNYFSHVVKYTWHISGIPTPVQPPTSFGSTYRWAFYGNPARIPRDVQGLDGIIQGLTSAE